MFLLTVEVTKAPATPSGALFGPRSPVFMALNRLALICSKRSFGVHRLRRITAEPVRRRAASCRIRPLASVNPSSLAPARTFKLTFTQFTDHVLRFVIARPVPFIMSARFIVCRRLNRFAGCGLMLTATSIFRRFAGQIDQWFIRRRKTGCFLASFKDLAMATII